MKAYDILVESKTHYLYEGLTLTESRSVKLWESVGKQLAEAALTSDQIVQIFQQVEKGATDSGNNRTLIGKGKDVASTVNQAWNDLKDKVQNSAPVKGIDLKYDQAAEKLKQATGGDAGVMKYVQKYRDFAKKHPVAQSFIYAALIAAAGISGAGAGGAAALGLFKMVDKLLQGDKFSSAAYAGAKTGAMAYGASKVADLFKTPNVAPDAASNGLSAGLNADQVAYLKQLGKDGGSFVVKDNQLWVQMPDNTLQMLTAPHGVDPQTMMKIAKGASESVVLGTALSETQIRTIFNNVISEGPLAGLGQRMQKSMQNIGHNLTTKVTADKLMKMWKQAGQPADSDAVAEILKNAGVDNTVIQTAFKGAGVKTVKPKAQKTTKPNTAQPTQTTQPVQATQKQKVAPSGNTELLSFKQIRAEIANLRKRDAQSLLKYVDSLGQGATAQAKQPTTAPAKQQPAPTKQQAVNKAANTAKSAGVDPAQAISKPKKAGGKKINPASATVAV